MFCARFKKNLLATAAVREQARKNLADKQALEQKKFEHGISDKRSSEKSALLD